MKRQSQSGRAVVDRAFNHPEPAVKLPRNRTPLRISSAKIPPLTLIMAGAAVSGSVYWHLGRNSNDGRWGNTNRGD
jgi:hypothetical protein